VFPIIERIPKDERTARLMSNASPRCAIKTGTSRAPHSVAICSATASIVDRPQYAAIAAKASRREP